MPEIRAGALLLDLDKTLVNVEDHVDYCAALEAARAAAAAHDVEIRTPRTTWGRCAHQAMELLVALAGNDARWLAASEAIERHELQGVSHSRPMPGLERFLEAARERGVAIVTLLGPRATAAVLEQHGISADAVVAREPWLRPKPAGDQVTEALRRLGVEAVDAVMIGDSSWDQAAAWAAGVRFLGLRNGRDDTAFDDEVEIVEGLDDVATALERS